MKVCGCAHPGSCGRPVTASSNTGLRGASLAGSVAVGCPPTLPAAPAPPPPACLGVPGSGPEEHPVNAPYQSGQVRDE